MKFKLQDERFSQKFPRPFSDYDTLLGINFIWKVFFLFK